MNEWRCDSRGWNAIGEESYAIYNKSIPYLLGDNNEMKEYKFVTEDGSFKIIYLGKNYKKKSLNSSPDKPDEPYPSFIWSLKLHLLAVTSLFEHFE